MGLLTIQNKIFSSDTVEKLISKWKKNNRKIVFTNGCFDILHKGHVTYLSKAGTMGDKLIIGLNSDYSVKKQNKETNRPINNEDARALVLASLQFVHAVILFNEVTPEKLINCVCPDILVKGGDYDASVTDATNPKYIVGANFIRRNGGKVVTIPFEEGYSTTSLINKIKNG